MLLLLEKKGKEFSKEEFIERYMSDFKFYIFKAKNIENLSVKQERLLECEKESCALSYELFCLKNGYAPDEHNLIAIVQRNFVEKVKLYRTDYDVISEEDFVKSYLHEIKKLPFFKLNRFSSDELTYVLEREKKIVIDYFRKHDDYPVGYESLMISRSSVVVNQSIQRLKDEFFERYKTVYKKFERSG